MQTRAWFSLARAPGKLGASAACEKYNPRMSKSPPDSLLPGRSSDFPTFTPAPMQPEEAHASPAKIASCGIYSALSRKPVLIVDDSHVCIKVLRNMLTRLGCTCDDAENGVIAVEKLKTRGSEYSMVFMDLRMPCMDGFEATRIAKKVLMLDALPIVAVTAETSFDARTK